jgi:hypothetical protein
MSFDQQFLLTDVKLHVFFDRFSQLLFQTYLWYSLVGRCAAPTSFLWAFIFLFSPFL